MKQNSVVLIYKNKTVVSEKKKRFSNKLQISINYIIFE